MQIVDACNKKLLCTLYKKFLTYCCFYPYISVWCMCVYIHTHFKSVCSNTSKYNRIIISISRCGVSSKLTLSVYSSRNVNTKRESTFINTKTVSYKQFSGITEMTTFLSCKTELVNNITGDLVSITSVLKHTENQEFQFNF
jgi:hypothetical protein